MTWPKNWNLELEKVAQIYLLLIASLSTSDSDFDEGRNLNFNMVSICFIFYESKGKNYPKSVIELEQLEAM